MATIITQQPASLTAVPGMDSTFSVVASTDILPLSAVSYTYQWHLSTISSVTDITGEISSSLLFDPLITDNGNQFRVRVVTLSSSAIQSTIDSSYATLTVIEDTPPYDERDLGKETGRERYRRLRHLGYI